MSLKRAPMAPVDYDQLMLAAAARASRLPESAMSELEAIVFADVHKHGRVARCFYVQMRNTILSMWSVDVYRQLILPTVRATMPPRLGRERRLLERTFNFLDRYGYINYGKFQHDPLGAAVKSEKHVCVIGAGIAGVTCAMQLARFGVTVTLYEASTRIGGRIYTYHSEGWKVELGNGLVMGVAGNPLTVIARQTAIKLTAIPSKSNLYDIDGKVISKSKDDVIEAEFNNLLEVASLLPSKYNVSEMKGASLSLGHALDTLLALQQRRVSLKRMEHCVTMEAGLDRCLAIIHKLQAISTGLSKEALALNARRADDDIRLLAPRGAEKEAQRFPDPLDKRMEYRALTIKHNARVQIYHDLMCELHAIMRDMKENDRSPPQLYMNAAEQRTTNWHMTQMEIALGTSLYNVSLAHWRGEKTADNDSPHSSVEDGFTAIVTAMAHSARGDLEIACGQQVTEVDYGAHGVRILSQSPSSSTSSSERPRTSTLECDACVIAVPLGVLKASLPKQKTPNDDMVARNGIRFTPPLPAEKSLAIRTLGFGCVNKVCLRFAHKFWEATPTMFARTSKTPGERGEMTMFWANGGPVNGGGTLTQTNAPHITAIISGLSAEKCEQIPDAQLVNRCMSSLTDVYGSIVERPVDTIVTRWRNMPFVQGAFSYVGVDGGPSTYDELAKPVSLTDDEPTTKRAKSENEKNGIKQQIKGKLYFAGEHTSREYASTVHGALLSGLREAARVADDLLGTSGHMPQATDKIDWAYVTKPIHDNQGVLKLVLKK